MSSWEERIAFLRGAYEENRAAMNRLGGTENTMTDDWETGTDAARSAPAPTGRVACRVVLLFGGQAMVVTPGHPTSDPLRVPAVWLAGELGVEVGKLPRKRFTAEMVGDELRDVRLS